MISLNLRERFNILEKYAFKCKYCGRSPPEVKLQLDHIIPKSKGGINNDDNLAPSCEDCNRGKFNKILDKNNEKTNN